MIFHAQNLWMFGGVVDKVRFRFKKRNPREN